MLTCFPLSYGIRVELIDLNSFRPEQRTRRSAQIARKRRAVYFAISQKHFAAILAVSPAILKVSDLNC
jgi:hypothetical protein